MASWHVHIRTAYKQHYAHYKSSTTSQKYGSHKLIIIIICLSKMERAAQKGSRPVEGASPTHIIHTETFHCMY